MEHSFVRVAAARAQMWHCFCAHLLGFVGGWHLAKVVPGTVLVGTG